MYTFTNILTAQKRDFLKTTRGVYFPFLFPWKIQVKVEQRSFVEF